MKRIERMSLSITQMLGLKRQNNNKVVTEENWVVDGGRMKLTKMIEYSK